MPSVLLGLGLHLLYRSVALWAWGVRGGVIKNYAPDVQRVITVLILELLDRACKERKADSCQVFWLHWHKCIAARVVCGFGKNGLSRCTVNQYEIVIIHDFGQRPCEAALFSSWVLERVGKLESADYQIELGRVYGFLQNDLLNIKWARAR